MNIDDAKIGYPRAGQDKFASCLRILDPFSLETLDLIEFENGEVLFAHYIT